MIREHGSAECRMQSAELRKISASGNRNWDFNGETNNNVPVGVGSHCGSVRHGSDSHTRAVIHHRVAASLPRRPAKQTVIINNISINKALFQRGSLREGAGALATEGAFVTNIVTLILLFTHSPPPDPVGSPLPEGAYKKQHFDYRNIICNKST